MIEAPSILGALFSEVFLAQDETNLEVLATRAGFNAAVRHIKKATALADTLGENNNLGDLLFEAGDEDLSGPRTALLLRMLLIDKWGYRACSANLEAAVEDPASLAEEFARWKAVDLLAAYHHPDLGLLTANPKVKEELARFGPLKKRELLVIYAGLGGKEAGEPCQRAAETALGLFAGARVRVPPELYRGEFTAKAVKPPVRGGAKAGEPKPGKQEPTASPVTGVPAVPVAPTIAAGQFRMTPRYSVAVQNECFHNGNVEAWKRIIDSYKAKYPDVRVYIYYEGERILDINSLLKWGKVKHGRAIQFALAGRDIRDVARLQRYLAQGASRHFEAFLRGPVSTILPLF
jgi:hypothetical protein